VSLEGEKMKESDLQVQVADYLRLRYPKVTFHSDYGSGIKLTKGQAVKQKRQNGGLRGWPDMFIAEPKTRPGFEDTWKYDSLGLFIELKAKGVRLKKKDGSWASEHIAEQNEMLSQLQKRGYAAYFAVGFEEAKDIIDDYLGGEDD
jgi:hypothetical protein